MEPHQTSDNSADDEAFLHDELEDILPEPSVDAEHPLTKKKKRQYWIVRVRSTEGEEKERPMQVRDVYNLPRGERVIIPFDGNTPSATDVDGLLGGFLGRLARDHKWFPICFDSWKLLLDDYKDKAWIELIKVKLWWDPIHEAAARTYIMKDIGKKWRENRINLFNTYYDPTKSRAENIKNPPLSISQIEWATFLNYRLRDKTKELSQKNTENRSKLKINHTGGSKKLKRRRAEIVSETGQEVSRGILFIDTHKKADGAYINEEARVVCEKIAEIENQGTAPVAFSPNDSLGQVLGKKHPGRVRGVGDGVCPSQVFRTTNPRFWGTSTSTNTGEVQQLKNEIIELKSDSKTKDGTIKIMASVLAQLLTNSSEPVPVELLNIIQQQSVGGQSSSSANNTQP